MAENNNDIYGYQPLWGNWYIEMPIGKGSFGSVYKISREEMGHKYTSAVKMISIPSEDQYREAEASFGHDEATLTGYFEDIVKNIIGEINMLYSLSGNSNIVAYQDHTVVKREDRIGWDVLIRMEYVTSLRNYLSDRQMSREEVIRLGIDLCSALELCSKKGIIHRDIKDENIFVNEDGVFKIGDFGIARELSKSGRAASMRGTPLYMAPEIFRGEKYDAAVDIYSLGIVMYKLLNNGRMPFMPPYPETIKFKDSEDALEKRMTGNPLPLPERSGESLGKAVLKACAYKPYDRYSSATEMKRELERVLVGMSNEEREEKVTLLNAKKESGDTKPKAQPQQKADEGTVSLFGSNPATTEKSEAKETIEEGQEAGNETVSIFNQAEDSLKKNKGTFNQNENNIPPGEETVSIFDQGGKTRNNGTADRTTDEEIKNPKPEEREQNPGPQESPDIYDGSDDIDNTYTKSTIPTILLWIGILIVIGIIVFSAMKNKAANTNSYSYNDTPTPTYTDTTTNTPKPTYMDTATDIPTPTVIVTVGQINIGDYIQFGKYFDEPILWKVVDKSNGVMLVSERVLCMKAFDAAESGISGTGGGSYTSDPERQGFGSNEWGNSNIREWLNSRENKVEFTTQPPIPTSVWGIDYNDYTTGNSYANEPGFLYNFTQNERNLIKTVEHDGVSDNVYLLSAKEFEIIGNTIKKPTSGEIIDNKSKYPEITYDNSWSYWLRTPNNEEASSYLIHVEDGSIYNLANNKQLNTARAACGYIGILPALNLKSDTLISSGDGAMGNLYIVTGD